MLRSFYYRVYPMSFTSTTPIYWITFFVSFWCPLTCVLACGVIWLKVVNAQKPYLFNNSSLSSSSNSNRLRNLRDHLSEERLPSQSTSLPQHVRYLPPKTRVNSTNNGIEGLFHDPWRNCCVLRRPRWKIWPKSY